MKCSECECLVRVKNKLGYNLYYCGYKKYGVLKALCGLYINNEEYRKDNETCKYYKAENKGRKEMTEEEKAEYILRHNGCRTHEGSFIRADKVIELVIIGLAEGRKEANEKNFKKAYQKYVNNSLATFDMKKALEDARNQIRLAKENAKLKEENKQIVERERIVPEHYLCEMIDKNKELKAQIEKIKKKCLDVMNVQENNLTDDYMAGMYNGMVVIYNSCFLDTANELEKSFCSKDKNGKWESEE